MPGVRSIVRKSWMRKWQKYNAIKAAELEGNFISSSTEGSLTLYNGYPLLDESYSSHYPYTMLYERGNSFESVFELQYDYDNRKDGNEGVSYFYGNHKDLSGKVNAAAYLTNQTAGALFADASDLRLEENTGYMGEPQTVILSISFVSCISEMMKEGFVPRQRIGLFTV